MARPHNTLEVFALLTEMDYIAVSLVLQELLPVLFTLVATFFGAWFAFKLNDNAHTRQTVRNQVAAVNRALLVLNRQLNTLNDIKSQIIDPTWDDSDEFNFISMKPSLPVGGVTPEIDVDSLTFLLETGDRGLLMELVTEQDRFFSSIQAINERSLLHREVLQPRMDAVGMSKIPKCPIEKIEEALGKPLVSQIRDLTNAATSHVKRTIESNPKVADKFGDAMKSAFPKHKIIQFKTVGKTETV